MILNPRKNSAITFPRVFRGFGQENSTEANAHTARTAMPPVERHFFRERISSISGMLQNVAAKSKASRPDSTPNFDDLGASYYYSTRPSIDSLNLHAFQLDCEEPVQPETTDGDENRGDSDCSDRTKKCFKGLLLCIVISLLWAISLHLLKLCYIQPKDLIHYNSLSRLTNFSDPSGSASLEGQLFDHVEKLDTASLQSTVRTTTTTTTTTRPGFNFRSKSFRNRASNQPNRTAKPKKPDYMTAKLKFNAPFFMSWYCSMFNVLFLPLFAFFRMSCFNRQNENITIKKIFVESIHHFIDRGFTTIQFFTRCILFCSLWTLANYLLIYGIRKLDATVSMTLFATSINFIYFLSWVILHNEFVGIRIVAAIICTTGVSLLAYMNAIDKRTSFYVLIGTIAAGAAATYKVFYRRIIGYTTFAQTSLFFTIVGFLNAFLIWPVVILLHLTGVEIFKFENIPWFYLTGAAIFNLFANLLGNFGVVFTYEIFLNLGMLFAIPISSFIDSYFYGVQFQGKKLLGIILISVSFLVVLLPENWNRTLTKIMLDNLNKWKKNEQMKKNAQRVQDTTTAQLSRLRTPSGRVK